MMGNIIKFTSEEASYDKQELNLLNLLNEDTLGHITSYISVRDLLNFSATCKYYQYVYLAPNRPQWAQMCQNLGGSSTVITAILSNSGVLKDDLEKIYEDKEKMKSVDFKRVIKEYYIFVLNKNKLRELLNPKLKDIVIYRGWMRSVLEIIPTIDLHPFNNWTLLNQYWTSLDLATAHYAKDYYYVVDLDVDPVSIEQISGTLPQYCANRLVLYKKSTDTAITKKEFLARTMTVT